MKSEETQNVIENTTRMHTRPLKNTEWMQLAHELQPASLRASRKAELTALKESRNHSPHSKG
ncbi:hypothetical protein, partial [Staphylococcus haemolyticus]|uniref:hypothetical protein n=1 Tax=Staphylococcus haemolyticus TaxID=1283 RepID=UPI001C5CA4E7